MKIKKQKLLYKELSYKVVGLCFAVHNKLGRFAREVQYGNELELLLKDSNLKYLREYRVQDSGNIIDFIVDNKILLEIKARPIVTKDDYYQVQRYLNALNFELGLLINFRNRFLKPQRILRPKDIKEVQ